MAKTPFPPKQKKPAPPTSGPKPRFPTGQVAGMAKGGAVKKSGRGC